MKSICRKFNIGEQGNKVLTGAMIALLVFSTNITVSAQTGFQGELNSVSITDASGINKPPIANFTYIQNGNTITFDAVGSSDADGSIIEYKWDFGDGSYGTGVSVSHAYVDVNSASVSLSVIDNSKGFSVYQKNIIVKSCSAQVADSSYVYSGKFTTDIYANTVWGQSFTPKTTGEMYSIKVSAYYIPNPSLATLMIRVGDTPDLSVVYDTEEIISLANYSSKDQIEVIFKVKPKITSGVAKYFMIYNTGVYATRFMLYRNSNSGYTGGADYTSKTGLADVVAGSGDLSFEVMVCD